MVIFIIFVVGLALGSFVNALVWRTNELERAKSKKQRSALSIVHGRSMCPNCKHELAAKDLLPVLSWVSLKGKCRYCSKPISAQYPLVELATAGLFVFCYHFWPYELTGIAWTVFAVWMLITTLLVALLVYDFKWMELPDKLVAIVSALSIFFVVALVLVHGLGATIIVNGALGGGLLFSLFFALFQVSKGRWIGGGDVKLAPALGLLSGSPLNAMMLLFVASLIGSVVGLPMILRSKNKHNLKLPFGPLLIVALFVVFFFGAELIDWYIATFLTF